MQIDMDGQWDLVVSSLQDIYNANVVISYDEDINARRLDLTNMTSEQFQQQLDHFQKHLENVRGAQRLVDAVGANVRIVLEHAVVKERARAQSAVKAPPPKPVAVAAGELDAVSDTGAVAHVSDVVGGADATDADASGTAASSPAPALLAKPLGRSGWVSQYNPSGPIVFGSEVAFKPKKGGEAEWFQCEVVKVSADGLRFEVRDPEPDELGNPGKTFKCTWKDVIFITPGNIPKSQIPNYPPGTKVLARYPETTTFYPAVVIGTKRDGTCRLKFDGEEEVDKETEVLRRLVLPCPTISSTMAKK